MWAGQCIAFQCRVKFGSFSPLTIYQDAHKYTPLIENHNFSAVGLILHEVTKYHAGLLEKQ